MTALECVEVAAALGAGGPVVERHLAGCGSCRATAAVLAVVRRASEVEDRDLWPRLRARLAEREDAARVDLRFPFPGWRAAAAVAAIVAATSLAPEPGRLLAVMLGLV
jgi:anti-sigma-K factor RskA